MLLLFLLLPWGSAGRPKQGSRWVLFSETAADYQSATLANLQPPGNSTTTSASITNTLPLCTHTISLLSLNLSLSLSFSLAVCEDASSTLQWRQIRPSQPCHCKTSPRKVATSSPFQLIYRHSKHGEEEGSPCSSITSSFLLSSREEESGNYIKELSEKQGGKFNNI